jgi:nitrite reductase/ring-hydroxylating ferredoxin subunit
MNQPASDSAAPTTSTPRTRVRPRSAPVPAEGSDGKFTESWFPICMSRELPVGKILGRPFLDGRVIAARGSDGVAQVLSAYCPHVGADLAAGKMVGNRVQCGFHRWEYNLDGWCEKTGLGDPPPKNACLYKFHTVEKFGLVWAFNGAEPWWQLPDYPKPESEIAFATDYDVPALPVDSWVVCSNTPDWQHLKAVHRLSFDHEAMFDRIDWTDHSMEYDLHATLEHGSGVPLTARVGIYGTSLFRLWGEFMGQWVATLTAFHLLAPGKTQVYYSLGTTRSNGTPEDDQRVAMTHDLLFRLGKSIVTDDRPILHTLRYTPGVMTQSDRALIKYLNMVRRFPRSHDSADFIN